MYSSTGTGAATTLTLARCTHTLALALRSRLALARSAHPLALALGSRLALVRHSSVLARWHWLDAHDHVCWPVVHSWSCDARSQFSSESRQTLFLFFDNLESNSASTRS